MKKTILSLCTVSCMMAAYAQKPATVNGYTDRKGKESLKLYNINHGRLEEIGASKADSSGRFGFLFYPEAGNFYVIGRGPEGVSTNKHIFYFKQGDQLNLSLNDTGFVLTGKNTQENLAIADWVGYSQEVSQPAVFALRDHSTYKEFFPKLQSLLDKLPAYKAAKTKNMSFDASFAKYRQADVLFWAMAFVTSPNSIHPTAADYPAFYKQLDKGTYTSDAFLMHYPYGSRIVGMMSMISDIANGKQLSMDMGNRLSYLPNDTLKGEVVLQSAGSLKTYLGYVDLQKTYGKYIITEDQQRRAEEISVKLAKEASKPGTPAINFTYPDINGKQVSLSDFKGKVVLVDVWATWCGPCKKEIPALKEMELAMRGQDVVFMSVSVDEQKDFKKWEDFVAKEELKGVQLFASGWSLIAKNYDIKGIPRFMVFDKKGNIVSTDAPRPSGTELKLLLEAELKK